MNVSRTKLSKMQVRETQRVVTAYLRTQPYITNRILRSLAKVNYDQAIQFFNLMLEKGVLQKEGKASGTRYTKAN